MRAHKFNPVYPHLSARNGTSSLLREALWSCSTAALAGLLEAGVLHGYATGRLAGPAGEAWWADARTLFFMLTWFYSQNIQFYTMHRLMHAWGTTWVPDLGAWLYRNVHSLHHESKNPTAFSGISMHPVEAALYLSYALLPALGGAHFMAFLYIKTNLIAAAMLCVRAPLRQLPLDMRVAAVASHAAHTHTHPPLLQPTPRSPTCQRPLLLLRAWHGVNAALSPPLARERELC
jgi:sterol desaturase/sphingolipid hydroxylase (fatty acid hydroxylase superfamily)